MELLRLPLQSGRWDDLPITSSIPTNIHLALLSAGKIPDPKLGLNEKSVQWVHDRDWTFTTSLPHPKEEPPAAARIALVFEGLDTFAEVFVAGKNVLSSDNMFLSHRVDITDLPELKQWKKGEDVEVRIVFESALKRGDAVMEKYGQRVCWNGHYSRTYVRKAQYHYGWDWGPALVTCGPWKPIYLEVHTARFATVSMHPTITPDLSHASLQIQTTLDIAAITGQYIVTATLHDPSGTAVLENQHIPASRLSKTNTFEATLNLPSPQLWHPRGFGPQSLYTITLKLFQKDHHKVLEQAHLTRKLGLRTLQLVQSPFPELPGEPLSGGTSFYFRINNQPVFCGGANWIPGDCFQELVSREKLETLLRNYVVGGHQRMLRVWGGGVYESEDFYELCDELGILVWQDAMHACGDYPAHLDWFKESVEEEVTQQMQRLRWHPSLVVVAGNNEDYQVADEEVGYGEDEKSRWREEPFPSRWLYEQRYGEIVRDVCNNGEGEIIGDANGSGVVYWPGSPWGGEDSTDRTIGDIHQWNVWGGIMAPYQRYPDLGGRFVSEFGMSSFPSLQTIQDGFLDPDLFLDESKALGDFHPDSEIIAHHQKAHSFEKRLYPYIHENFRRDTGSLEEWVYLTQMLQRDAMHHAFKGWRAKWGSRECGGVLVWQLNDVWPVTSWSIVDHYLRPKQAFYSIKRALQPLALVARRYTNDPKPNSKVEALARNKTAKAGEAKMHSTPHVYPPKKSKVNIVLSSISPESYEDLRVVVKFVDVQTGGEKQVYQEDLSIDANATKDLDFHEVPEDRDTVVYAAVYKLNNLDEPIAKEYDWPQPLKWVRFGTPEVSVYVEMVESDVILNIKTTLPVTNLWFEQLDGEIWDDNGVDIVPSETARIRVGGWKRGNYPMDMRFYGMEE